MLYQKNNNMDIAEVDGVFVAFANKDLNNPVIINGISNDILTFCEKPREEDQIISYVLDCYDCSDEKFEDIGADIKECLSQMVNARLLSQFERGCKK